MKRRTPYYGCVNRDGEIVRELVVPTLETKVCPYCWEPFQAPQWASAFCSPEHAARWRSHVRSVSQGRERAMRRTAL